MPLTRIDLLSALNTLLDADYASIDNVPDDALRRAVLLLKIEVILRDLEDRGVPVQIFMCRSEDIDEQA